MTGPGNHVSGAAHKLAPTNSGAIPVRHRKGNNRFALIKAAICFFECRTRCTDIVICPAINANVRWLAALSNAAYGRLQRDSSTPCPPLARLPISHARHADPVSQARPSNAATSSSVSSRPSPSPLQTLASLQPSGRPGPPPSRIWAKLAQPVCQDGTVLGAGLDTRRRPAGPQFHEPNRC
jgi:hypothetical protein